MNEKSTISFCPIIEDVIDKAFLDSKALCEEVMVAADQQCQSIWNGVHSMRKGSQDVTAMMAEATLACREVRRKAKEDCCRLRDHARRETAVC